MLINLRNISSSPCHSHEIELPLSKSESNRALMILHYSNYLKNRKSENLKVSDSDDTILLCQLLNKINEQSLSTVELDCANAGTVFRFLLTAVANLQLTINNEQLTVEEGKWVK